MYKVNNKIKAIEVKPSRSASGLAEINVPSFNTKLINYKLN